MARVFPFILKTKHKTLHIKHAWAELEILQKKTICTNFDRSSLIFDRLSQEDLHKHEQQTLNESTKVREERCKHKITPRRVIEEETEELGEKPLRHPPNGKSIY